MTSFRSLALRAHCRATRSRARLVSKSILTRNTYLAITLAKLGLVTALKLSPVDQGLRTGWVTYHEYCRKGPYVVLSFRLLLFCVLCGVIVKSVLKSRFRIISASGFRKRQRQSTNMAVQFA